MKGSFLIASAAIIAGSSLGMANAAAAPSSSSQGSVTQLPHDCKGLTGARWKLAGHTGTHYDAAADGVTCAFVKTWVARLEGPAHKNGNLTGGPAGWTCIVANRYFLRCQDSGNTKVFTVRPGLN